MKIFNSKKNQLRDLICRVELLNHEKRLLMDALDIQVWYLKDKMTYGMLNKSHAEFLGLSSDKLQDHPVLGSLSEENAEKFLNQLERVYTDKTAVTTEEWVQNSRGEERLLRISKVPIMDSASNISEVLCYALDVTENHQSKYELHKVKNRLYELLDRMPDKRSAKVPDKSHSPTKAILLYTELVAELKRMDSRSIDFLKDTRSNDDLLTLLIEELECVHKFTILVVERDDSNYLLTKELLARNGISTIRARDAVDALTKVLRKQTMDLVILNSVASHQDDRDVIQFIRRYRKGIPIVVMSDSVSEEDRLQVERLGANALIKKPIRIPEVISTVKELLCSSYADSSSRREAFQAILE